VNAWKSFLGERSMKQFRGHPPMKSKDASAGYAEIKSAISAAISKGSMVVPHVFAALASPSIDFPIPQFERIELSSTETKRIVRLVGSHPLLELNTRSDLVSSIDRLYGPIPSLVENLDALGRRSRDNLSTLLESTKTQNLSQFNHVDIIARRESKCEVSLLLDLTNLNIPKPDIFFLCPVESNIVLSQRTGGKRLWQSSLIFQRLADSITNDELIQAVCSTCRTMTKFDDPQDFKCSNPACESQSVTANIDDIHPGGNRRYYGPAVPNMGRVWVGVTEKLERRSERVGILTATVYSLFHDSADVNRRGRVALKFPTANPRIQWTMMSYK